MPEPEAFSALIWSNKNWRFSFISPEEMIVFGVKVWGRVELSLPYEMQIFKKERVMKAKSFFIILFSKKYIVPSDLIPVSIEPGDHTVVPG